MAEIQLKHWNESDQKAIRRQMDRIIHSGPFHQSHRRQRFLEYLVNETLAGRSDRLKGYNIALEVFERPETFDPIVHPLVRIEAARLREKLREYYDADGKGDPIRIDLPKGSYTPHIEFRQSGTSGALPDGPDGPLAVTKDRSPSLAKAPAAIVDDVDDQASPAPARSARRVRWQMTVALLTLVLVLSAAAAWLTRERWMPRHPEAARDEPAVATPNVPAIAVLPFTNLSGDPKQDYFSDGLTEDILTELSRARDLRVIARNTTFQYKGKAVDVSKLGRELKVRYLLEGSVQRASDRLRVTAQLIDTETGAHVWADRYDRELADVFLVQDEIAGQGGHGLLATICYDLVLNKEDVGQFAIVDEVGENVGTGPGVDELRCDAEAVVGALYTALEHVTYAELMSSSRRPPPGP